jgi:2,3-bisphosphoglycerate-dependent phosphoglycerate mutase
MAKILIVDDDFEIVSLLTEILEREGHQIFSAGEPVEGMRQAREQKPDLVILDYHMPGTTGAHLFESLRRNQASRVIPILFMSGEASPEQILAEISDTDSAQFLAKPLHLNEFRRAVAELLASGKEKPMPQTSGKIVLVRHGQSQWNLENRFTGWEDVAITELGAEEAHRAGKELQGIRFDAAFTSELKRAQQTLDILLQELGQTPPIAKDKALNERHYGDLQGLDKAETAKKYGDQQVHIWRRSYDVRPPGGESLKDTAERTLPYFKSKILPEAAAGRSVLVAAHGNSLRAIVMELEGLTPAQIMEVNIGTCRPIIYEIDAAGKVTSKKGSPVAA